MKIDFPLLRAKDIDCRIQSVKSNGLVLLLYKNARVDMALLDRTVGPLNWKREHTRDNANCIVSIWDDEKKQWISKEDTGTESNTEREKGLASDSFKRACFNWGIGRELYSAPFTWIPAAQCNIQDGKCYDRFVVDEIEYNEDRDITFLSISRLDRGGKKPVFSYGQPGGVKYVSEKERTVLRNLCEKKGWDPEKVFTTWPDLTAEQYVEAVRRLQG